MSDSEQRVLEDLAERARNGCSEARNALLDATRPGLYRIAFGILNDSELAEDAVQEAQLELVKKGYDTGGDPIWPWLITVASRKALMIRRQRSNSKPHNGAVSFTPQSPGDDERTLDPEDKSSSPEEIAIRRETIREVQGAIAALSDEQREVLFLIAFEGLSLSEIKETLDIPLPTLKSRLKRARELLKEALLRESVPKAAPASG